MKKCVVARGRLLLQVPIGKKSQYLWRVTEIGIILNYLVSLVAFKIQIEIPLNHNNPVIIKLL